MVEEKKEEKSLDSADEIQQGVFSIDREQMNKQDLNHVSEVVKDTQKNGSVFYQDVISFDTDFLIKEGILNKKKDVLDEHRLQVASRKMMKKMFEDEKITNRYWFASIHRNTDHIHIHFGSVEKKNTRKVIKVEEDGQEYFAPKGKRKQQTIDNMKSTFSNSLIDRTAQLTRISDLRNTLVEDVKKEALSKNFSRKQKELFKNIYEGLPENKKHWQYGSKYLPKETKIKIKELTRSLMKDNPNYKEFIKQTSEESTYRKKLFGESKRDEKVYFSNKQEDIDKRMGNALLKSMRSTSNISEKSRTIYIDSRSDLTPSKKSGSKNNFLSTERNLKKIKHVLDNDMEKYRAEREYEQLEERIAYEKQFSR